MNRSIIFKQIEWLICILVVITIFGLLSARLPTNRWFSLYAVASGSMEPAVRTGSIAISRPIAVDQLKSGQIIAFAEPGIKTTVIIHRIVSLKTDGGQTLVTTKGDANNGPDGWQVTPTNIKGKIGVVIPWLGYPLLFAQTPLGFGLLIGLPALILIGLQLRDLKLAVEEEIRWRAFDQSRI